MKGALANPCCFFMQSSPVGSFFFLFTLGLHIYPLITSNQVVSCFSSSSKSPFSLVHNLCPVSQHVSAYVICFVASPVIFNRRRLTQLSAGTVSTHHCRTTGWHIFRLSLKCGIFITLLCLALRCVLFVCLFTSAQVIAVISHEYPLSFHYLIPLSVFMSFEITVILNLKIKISVGIPRSSTGQSLLGENMAASAVCVYVWFCFCIDLDTNGARWKNESPRSWNC